jgi:ubiquinone/menaquinone biosynthesis C-methylase UbiE
MHITPDLVLRVNEVFHDVEGAAYSELHPEIFRGEAERWDQIARAEIAARPRPLRVLDVGCGTGFVAQRVAPVLSAGDVIVCADLSQTMLDTCRTTVSHTGYKCRFEFAKLDGRSLPQADGSCDIVTMNSVLHHLPDLAAVLREVDRVLKVGGLFIVAHEPNRSFYANRWMRTRARVLGAVISPRQTAGALLRRAGAMGVVHRLTRRRHHKRVLDEVNRRLLETEAIRTPLSQDEMTAIVDIQSPTAGGWHADRGIDIEALAKQHLPNFDCRLTTYDHLGSGTDRSGGWIGRYASRIARHRPSEGATLLAILTKRRVIPIMSSS